ncbi:recombinase family protein [Lacrimispora saccharolytica]|nr:recombinase family protein [Lacrimispora saccharolytica]
MNKKKLKVAAYARVSTDKEDQANSLLSQRTYFADYITHHEGWKLSEVYYDEGITGTQTKKRTGFNQMVQDALHGEVDLIITKEVARFARNTVDTLSYTRQLKAAGVGVIFTIDNIDTRDADGELRLTIMASIAQEESRKTSERVKWGQKRQMEKGIVFGRDLLGYTVQNGKLYINEEEVPIVKAIFHKYTNEGKGTWTIARELLAEGMRPKRIALWSNVVILRVLRNEKYVGDLCQKKTYTPDYLTHAKKYNRGEEETVYLKDHHEPIIDRDLWNRTQAELERRSSSEEQKSKHSNRYWCSGKIRCAECRNRYVSRTKKLKSGETYKAWRCYAAANHGTKKQDADGNEIGCDNSSINDRSLKTCMNYCITLVQGERDSLKREILEEISQLQKTAVKKSDSKKIQKKIDSLEMKKRKAIDLMLDGLISKEDLQNQTAWYNEELEKLNIQLTDAFQKDKLDSRQINNMEQYIKAIDEIMGMDGNSEEVYKEVLDHMEIHKENVVDVWLKSIPFGIRLKIKATGKREYFKTEILETQFIEN